jgi:hypothetical protein
MFQLLFAARRVTEAAAPPSAARRFAIAAPMPREAPVMSATLPASGASSLAWSDLIEPPYLRYVYYSVQ